MVQDGEALSRLYADALVAARMSKDLGLAEGFVCLWVRLVQRISVAEAIDQRR